MHVLKQYRSQRGVTLLELIVATTILLILMGAAVPSARFVVKRQKETELRRDLLEMRLAVDRYKAAADSNAFTIKLGTNRSPPDPEHLGHGMDGQRQDRPLLRRLP